ncbi:hypothetical protein [Bacillus sp. 165]|uniref:hypothetical protein n=1 Tax=Bacillus sp. 165 TaxID=1529117 RepID=UPI001ADD48BA|nr:hypothetical protein [Bacillus sp. 165]MBO9131136.1 hypothetical protein [Bacillus sp. 165]
MSFFAIIIVILLVHFLIIRPLTNRNRPYYNHRYESRGYNKSLPSVGGFGKFGAVAGGAMTGVILTYLLDQGRIDLDQYSYFQQLGDHQAIQELMDQNIIQEHEINDLEEELTEQDSYMNDDWDDDNQDNFESNDQDFGGSDDFTGGGDD